MKFLKKKEPTHDIEETLDQLFDKVTRDMYRHHFKRWRDLCGVKINQRIDYKLPCVEIESKLDDPRNLKMIRGGKHTADFLQLLSTE